MRVFIIGDDVSSALGRHQVCWPIARISAGRANKFGRASWAALRPTDTMTEKTVMLSENNGRTDSARSGFSTRCQSTLHNGAYRQMRCAPYVFVIVEFIKKPAFLSYLTTFLI